MKPHGRPPFPLDAPTPIGYKIGAGRGARPVGSAREFFQLLKKRKTKGLQPADIDDLPARPPTEADAPTDIDRSVKQFVSETRSAIQASDWEHIPAVTHEVARRKKISANTVNLGTNQTVTPNVLFESTKFIKQASAMAQNASTNELTEKVKVEMTQGADGDFAAESTHIQDMEEARAQIAYLKSIVEASPADVDTWLDLSRVYAQRGERSHAKRTLQKACEENPEAEALWVAYIDLVVSPKQAKSICEIALEKIPTSDQLWCILADRFTTGVDAKQGVLLEAAEHCPESSAVWCALLELFESPEEKILIIEKALECVQDIEFYLAFAAVETDPRRIRAKLSEARRLYPTRAEIYVAAARQEAGRPENIPKIVQKAFEVAEFSAEVRESTAQRFGLSSESLNDGESLEAATKEFAVTKFCWYEVAEGARDSPAILEAIVDRAMDESIQRRTATEQRTDWLADAQALFTANRPNASEALLCLAVAKIPQSHELWAERLRQVPADSIETKISVLREATEKCPRAVQFWKELASLYEKIEEPEAQIETLDKAVAACPRSEDLWVALAKATEEHTESSEQTREVYSRACAACPSSHMFLQHFIFERRVGDIEPAQLVKSIEELLQKGRPYSDEWRPWAMALEIINENFDSAEIEGSTAQSFAQKAREAHPQSVRILQLAAAIHEKLKGAKSADDLFKAAYESEPASSAIAAAYIEFLVQRGEAQKAKEIAQTALRTFRAAPADLCNIYAASILTEPLERRLSTIRSALSLCPGHCGLLWKKAFTLYQLSMRDDAARAARELIEVSPRHGDAWALVALCEPNKPVDLPEGEGAPSDGEFWLSIAENPIVCGHDGCLLDPADILELTVEKLREAVA